MTVYFIGAGPGAPDLITLRGRDLIARCPLVLYAGSLVPHEILGHARSDARLVDSAAMTLDEIVAAMAEAASAGEDVARVHSGDPSLYGAIAEQMRRLDQLGIDYDVVPGVPAFAAAAAALKTELTLPGVSQTVILTRTAMKASPMPEGEELAALGRSGATLAVQLPILAIGGAAGIWLFYVQHQFEGVYWEHRDKRDYVKVGMQGSSFYKLPRILQWFSGNIGFHHIHHLNPSIPNYRLPVCQREQEIFQAVKPLTLRMSLQSLRMRLYDEDTRRMVGFRAA